MKFNLPKKAAGLALAIAVVAPLSACSTAENTDPVANGVLNWGIAGENLANGKMDPHASQLDETAFVSRQVLDSLVYLNADGEFKPWLAKSWEQSADARSYTFTLRDDVTFSDGSVFNAEAVKMNFEHILAPTTKSAHAKGLLGGDDLDPTTEAIERLYESTEVVGEFMVRVNFVEPFAPFLANASTAYLGMYSPKVLTEKASQLSAGGPGVTVGSGPFVMTDFKPKDVITYTRNKDYKWAPEGMSVGSKAVQTLNLKFVPEGSVRIKSVESGELDLATEITPNLVETTDAKVEFNRVDSPGLPYSLFLNEKNGVFADPLVREAFTYGIDVDAAVKSVFFEQYDQAFSILSPTTPNSYYGSLEGSVALDEKKANELLDQAGWTKRDSKGIRTKDGKKLEATWISYTPVSEEQKNFAALFADDLKKIGFKLTHKVLEPAEYMEAYRPGTYDLADWSFASADADVLRQHLHTSGFQNASRVSDEQLDAQLEQASASTDAAERERIYKEVQQWNVKYRAILPLYNEQFITAQAPTVHKVKYDLFGWPILIEAETSHTK